MYVFIYRIGTKSSSNQNIGSIRNVTIKMRLFPLSYIRMEFVATEMVAIGQ